MKLTKNIFHFRSHHQHQLTGQRDTLDELPTGSSAVIMNLSGGKHISSRLASIGMTIGSEVQILQNYHHGPIILSVRGVRLALGRGEAKKIEVESL
jgi:ferrous iron transport protein A